MACLRVGSLVAGLLLAGIQVGCATGAKGGTGGVLLIEPARVGKGCEAWNQPAPLPASATLLKAGVLQPPAGGSPSGTLLLAMRFDQDGQLDRLATIGGTMADSLRAPLEGAVRRAVIPDKRYASGSFRVLLAVADSVTTMVGRSEYCPPVIVSGASGTGSVTVDMPADRVPNIETPHYSVLVNKSGRIVQSKLLQSSGNRTIDDDVARGFPNWRLRPALLDGAPIAAWINVPAR